MKYLKVTVIAISASAFLFSCGDKTTGSYTSKNSVADQSAQTPIGNENDNSGEIKIGIQTWSTTNLNVSTFRNGDAIPEVKSDKEWDLFGKEGKPAWCYYNNDPSNGEKYGKLYNWFAVIDKRNLAPKGWRLPNDTDWTTLTNALGGATSAGLKMKSSSGWKNKGNGNNTSGFKGLPAGYRYFFGPFYSMGVGAYWWSTSELFTYDAFPRYLNSDYDNIYRFSYDKQNGLSVRCLKE